MQVKEIPRRRFIIDVDGKQFKAKELSLHYLQESLEGGFDDVDLALKDGIGEITKEDLKSFGVDTKNEMYLALLQFTFKQDLEEKDIQGILKAFSMSQPEWDGLNRESQLQLKTIMDSRKPRDKDLEKKA